MVGRVRRSRHARSLPFRVWLVHAMKRRDLLIASSLGGLLPGISAGQARREITDAAGRKVALPAKVERIYAAGPPAGVLIFAVAPDKLIGWTSAWRDAEK